jgi:hypothetical protein
VPPQPFSRGPGPAPHEFPIHSGGLGRDGARCRARKRQVSACGGGRSYSDHGLDPEYRYILEQGEELATRYRGDAVLHKFYRMVAESERHQAEWNRRAFQDEDDVF